MNFNPLSVAIIGSLVLVGACSKKEEPLPPPPPPAATPAPPPPPPTVQNTTVPGSFQDFMEQVGSDRVFFEYDSYALEGDARTTLEKQAAWLQKYPNVTVTIEGHADERGTREYNLALGDRRANAAKNYLVSQGVSADRVTTISYGKERPEALGSNEEAWAKNRRAVTVLQGAAS